jgi:hypothetical protein
MRTENSQTFLLAIRRLKLPRELELVFFIFHSRLGKVTTSHAQHRTAST